MSTAVLLLVSLYVYSAVNTKVKESYFCCEALDAAAAVGSGIISSSDLYTGVCLCIWMKHKQKN